MKSISFLNLFDLEEIDEIYIDKFTKENIVLPKSKFIKDINEINYNIDNKKKILFLTNSKNFRELSNFNLNQETKYQYCLFEIPYIYNLKKLIKNKFTYKIYYFLPNIKNPEIIIMQKDLKYLSRYWAIKKIIC